MRGWRPNLKPLPAESRTERTNERRGSGKLSLTNHGIGPFVRTQARASGRWAGCPAGPDSDGRPPPHHQLAGPNPTRARASAPGAAKPANESGSGRRLLIYYQSPGYRQGTILAPFAAWGRLPGSGGTWPLDILVCSAAPWPPRTQHSRMNGQRATRTIRVNERTNERNVRATPLGTRPRCRRGGSWRGAVTVAMAITASHGGHGLPRPNVPSPGHDPCVAVITARTRRRGHGPLWRCRC